MWRTSWNNLTAELVLLQRDKRFSLPLCPPITTVMTNWNPALTAVFSPMCVCQELHFQLADTVVSFLPACWNSGLNCHHLVDWQSFFHSGEFPLVKIRDVHVPMCSTHVTLLAGHNTDPEVVFQTHQHSFSLDLSRSRAEKLQESAGCWSKGNQMVSDYLWLLYSPEKHCHTPLIILGGLITLLNWAVWSMLAFNELLVSVCSSAGGDSGP